MKKISFIDNWLYNGSRITLPHDAMLHEARDQKAACGSAGAFFPGGEYVYEKKFEKPDAAHALLQFEGVYQNAKVYVNGVPAGGADYGYIPFFIDLDPYLKDGQNIVRVACEVVQPDSRWYSGAGIYRPVWLWTGPENSIDPESVRISTVSYAPAVIRVQSPKAVTVAVDGVSGEGTDFELTIPNAKLWSDETPNLYTAKVTNGADEAEITFGIRKVEWSNKGLFINGKETLLRGGCVHHDSGILGAATYDESEYRRVRKMKEAGFNAIRSAHNPASRAMLEACDELGVYLMDEGWDMWYYHKSKYDYAAQWRENHLSDLAAMVDRDFNHPSVIMYSIGNEVSEPAKAEGVAAAREMVEFLHRADPTRPVTGGFNLMIIDRSAKGKGVYDENGGGRDDSSEKKMSGMSSTMFNMIASMVGTGMNKGANSAKADAITSPVLDALDIAGYNYASGRYPLEGKAHPDRVIFGSETFPQDIAKNWAMVKKYPYLTGDFMWTAWDYLGEAGIGAWAYTPDGKGFNKPYPWLLADTGAMDILGNPNGELFHAAAVWGKLEQPVICVQPINHDVKPAKAVWRGTNAIPSWSWQGCEGRKAVVEVYTDAESVELKLNGKTLGTKKVRDCKATFKVKYAPSTMTAIAGGKSSKLISAGEAAIAVRPETTEAKPSEILYIPIAIADKH
ncbi:MAG: glycoside hydrolase family 2 protein, partial [Clostridia bacterium]|nr:glycoside hydrolase family 2 protein [Clostridia bacterium]